MFIPKEQIGRQHADLKQGSLVDFHGMPLVVTQLGLISRDDLQPHPYQNFYKQGANASKPYFREGS